LCRDGAARPAGARGGLMGSLPFIPGSRMGLSQSPSPGARIVQLGKMSEMEHRTDDDFRWALRSPEVMQHPDYYRKLVVVHNKRVLAAGRDRQALVEQAAEEVSVPWQHLVVVVVPPAFEVWEDPPPLSGVRSWSRSTRC